nr:PREDICTED: protein FAR1-RELATED SEQUENCE 5-like [Nicotiana tabacum]
MCENSPEEVLQSNSQGTVDYEPKLGLEFDSDKDALNYYNEYARRVGFSVRKEYINTNKELGYVTSRKITCFKEGFRRDDKRKDQVKKLRRETRTGYQAHIIVTRHSMGKYHITKVKLEHNHALVSPTMVHMLPSHRRINEVQAHEIDLAEDAGLFSKTTFDFMSLQDGGRVNLGYTKLNQKNYLRTKRQKAMRRGETGVLLKYFEKKRIEDPSLFFATNREHKPLASFVGLNNHRKMVVFEGALMYDETADFFQWLFETFLGAMSEKNPKIIFTDQDAAISKAISLVMPEVYHRLCVWHMEQNAAKHLKQIYKRYASFRGDFRKCIYEYEDEHMENKSGGMNNTQLSESLNGDLKDYLQSDYNLVQFFKYYDRAIEDKRYNELQDTCDASQHILVLKAQVPILIHAREVYTSNIFAKFQDEYMKSLSIKVNIGCGKNILSTIYNVSKHGHTREYIVTVTEVGHISYTCLKFESMGILCCDAIRVLDVVKGVSRIPTEHILDRWTKNAKGVNIKEVDEQEIEIKDPKLITMNRYRVLCPIFVRMVAKTSKTDDGYKVVVACANELSSKLKQIAEVSTPSFCTSGSTRDLPEENNNIIILTRAKNLKKKDGKRHKKRIKPSLEVNANCKKARGNKSSSAKQDGPRVDDRALSDNDKYFIQNPISKGNIYENSDLSTSQTITCASLSHSSEFSLSLPYPNFTQMLTEPFSLDTFAHVQKSYLFFHDQANLFESRGSQKFQDNNTL